MFELLCTAREALKNLESPIPITRELVMAYACLSAYVDHWPKDASTEDRDLLKKNDWIRSAEPQRFIKQRRIYIGILAELWNRPAMNALAK